MGFPLSTFQQLAGLCKKDPIIVRTFNEFRLICVIVHNPKDDGFRRTIKYSFEHLHEVTGKNFAFISFLNPPTRWAASHTGWMDVRERLSCGEGLDDVDFVNALQSRLDLPDNSCLVLTANLLSDNYVILPTNKDCVVSQMEAISEYVNTRFGRFLVDEPEFLQFLSRLGPAFREQTVDGKSLAKNIADLVAIRALNGAGAIPDNVAKREQISQSRSYVKNELKSLWDSLSKSKETDDLDETGNSLERFSDSLAQVVRSAKGNNYSHSYWDFRLKDTNYYYDNHADLSLMTENIRGNRKLESKEPNILRMLEDEGLEPKTLIYLANFNTLLPIYTGNGIYNNFFSGIDVESLFPEGFKMDFSPLGNYLGKAMEEEMNASLVQRVRQLKGVHMPEYYRKFEEDLNNSCTVRTLRKDIELNKRGKMLSSLDYSDWSYPIGEVLCVLRELAKDELMALQMEGFCSREFIEEADVFARNRNAACHSGIFGRAQFNTMYSGFQSLKTTYLPKMIRIKELLR